MSAVDVYGQIADRLVGGMMFHDDHATLMEFLGYQGLKRVHESGYLSDSADLRRVQRYCVSHLGQIAPRGGQKRVPVLDPLMGMRRGDIDDDTRLNKLRSSMDAWVDWETETKKVYERAWESLMRTNDTSAMRLVEHLIANVDDELSMAVELRLGLQASGWDMPYAMDIQPALEKEYKAVTKALD